MKLKFMVRGGFSRIIKLVQKPAVRSLINLLVLGFCIYYLVIHFQEIISVLRQARINGWLMSMAWLITWVVNWLGGVSWWLLLSGLNYKVDWLEGWQAHFKPVLAKYIPGFIWQYVGKGVLTGALGVPARVIGLLLVWEFFQVIWLGLAIGLLFIPGGEINGWVLQAGSRFGLRAAGIVMFAALPGFILLALKFNFRSIMSAISVRRKYLFLSVAVVTFGWLLHGLALWMTLASFREIQLNTYPYFVFSFSMSLVGGILALPVPNGLGVREGIMVYLLSPVISKQVALSVSVISRLQLVSGEFFCVLFFEVLRYLRSKRRSKRLAEANTSKGLL